MLTILISHRRSGAIPLSRCAQAAEFATLSLGCPAGKTIGGVEFASFGTPSGSCAAANLRVDAACNANTSVSVVKKACVGKSNCSVVASSAAFGFPVGHPCLNVLKDLIAQVRCTGDPPGLPPPAPPAPLRAVHAQAFEVTEHDSSKAKKLLLVNKQDSTTAPFDLVGAQFKCMESIDGRAPWSGPKKTALAPGASVSLAPFGVAILTETACK